MGRLFCFLPSANSTFVRQNFEALELVTFLLVVISALLHAGWNLIAKRYSGNYSIIYLSFVGGWAIGFPWAVAHFNLHVDWALVAPLVAITGLLHAVYGYLLTLTYRHGDISTLYPLVRGSGVGLAVAVAIFGLGEQVSPIMSIGMAIAMAGIVLVTYRRDRATTSKLGIALALLCGLLIGTYTVLDKLIVKHLHPLMLLNMMQAISALTFLPYVLLQRKTELRHAVNNHIRPILLISLVALVSYAIILYVLTEAPLSRVVIAREMSVAFGAIGGIVFFKESYRRSRVAGIVLILLGIVLIRW